MPPHSPSAVRLFIPGPVDVPDDAMRVQTEPLFGHRSPDMDDLFASVQPMLQSVFCTASRVYVFASSGTGMHEACIRNGVSLDGRVLILSNGAFADRWHDVAAGCGRNVRLASQPWFEAFDPSWVEDELKAALQSGPLDAVCLVHNETSTGVLNPLREIAACVRSRAPETLLFVDAVSSLAGAEVRVDDCGIDVCLTSSQKALAVPPGLSFAAVSDRTLERARGIQGRGWYFDFLNMEKYLLRGQIPATPAISLIQSLQVQLQRVLDEGLEARWSRHLALRDHMRGASGELGLTPLVEETHASPTVTTLQGGPGLDVGGLISHLRDRNIMLSDGYGPQKGKSMRVGHMGEMQLTDLDRLFDGIAAFG